MKSYIDFRFAYFHLTLAHSKGHSQGQTHFRLEMVTDMANIYIVIK